MLSGIDDMGSDDIGEDVVRNRNSALSLLERLGMGLFRARAAREVGVSECNSVVGDFHIY